jgi:hypothetical protein
MNLLDKKLAGSENSSRGTSMAAATLSEDVMRALQRKFPDVTKFSVSLGEVSADLVVEAPRRVMLAEFKTGNPELPLPRGTVPQIRRVVEQAKTRYPDQEIVPVVVTNYEVDPDIREALEEVGAKIVEFSPRKTTADNLVLNIVQQAGLQETV